MSDRIDHAETARAYVMGGDFAETPDGRSVSWNLSALTHATLALVEQQRIANLIALADHAHERFGNYAGEAGGIDVLFSYGPNETSNIQLRAEIREGLGL